MHKHSIIFLNLFIYCSTFITVTMEQELIHRKKIEEFQGQKEESAFSKRTIKEILQEPCPACLEPLHKKKGAITLLYCQHGIHNSCFNNLKKHNHLCPHCRGPLEHFENDDDEQLESFENDDHEAEPGCCVAAIERFFNCCNTEINDSRYVVMSIIQDLSDPNRNWHERLQQVGYAFDQCAELPL